MMAKHNPLVRFYEIFAVIMDFAGCSASVVQREHTSGNPFGIKPITDHVTANGRDEYVSRVKFFTAM
jgi:hypothetical protein